MLNKLTAFVRQYAMIQPGDRVICALSGGADSVALVFALYLLKEKMGIQLEAAHFNHHLRGEESDRDEAFVADFCSRYDIPLHLGSGEIKPGRKGLEAAAREARYAFLRSLPGKIATAHTADDNAETVLMHLVRGTGLKGLGGITPVSGNVIRPMLTVTRAEVEAFLNEYYVNHITDSSNETDAFLRNRLRRHVMPLLTAENPRLAESLSAMALRLRQDEDCLSRQAAISGALSVEALRNMHGAIRSRILENLLKQSGVREPEQTHIAMAEALVFSEKPSARASFPGGVVIRRRYDVLEKVSCEKAMETVALNGVTHLPELGLRVTCCPAAEIVNTPDTFTVCPRGDLVLRCRRSGDEMRLSGGTKSLKKLFIDRKIPASRRLQLPVLADDDGVLGVYTIGVNLDRAAQTLPAVTVRFEITDK